MKKLLLSILLLGGLSASAQSEGLNSSKILQAGSTLENHIVSETPYGIGFKIPKPSLFDVKEELVLVSREYLVDKTKLKAEQTRRVAIKKDYESKGYAFKEVKVIDAKCYLVFVK